MFTVHADSVESALYESLVERDEWCILPHVSIFEIPAKNAINNDLSISFLADDNALRIPVGDVAPGDEPPPWGPAAEQRLERGGNK